MYDTNLRSRTSNQLNFLPHYIAESSILQVFTAEAKSAKIKVRK